MIQRILNHARKCGASPGIRRRNSRASRTAWAAVPCTGVVGLRNCSRLKCRPTQTREVPGRRRSLPDLENPLADGRPSYFQQASEQIGVTETNDFIFGPLHEALRKQLFDAVKARKV